MEVRSTWNFWHTGWMSEVRKRARKFHIWKLERKRELFGYTNTLKKILALIFKVEV